MLGSRARCHVVRVGMYELSDGVIGDGTNLVCITELDTMKCRVFFWWRKGSFKDLEPHFGMCHVSCDHLASYIVVLNSKFYILNMST